MNGVASGGRRFRYAPTPTRELHVGNGLAALVGWGAARAARGAFVLRVEDIDASRCRPELTDSALADLHWLGVDWDEGPEAGGPCAPYIQSERLARYDSVLEQLRVAGLAYPCRCSRADVRVAMRAPHLHEGGETPYAGTCRPEGAAAGGALAPGRGGYRLDLRAVPGGAVVQVHDAWLGASVEDVRDTCGDFLLGRPGAPTYQLAAVADDIAMGVTDVVRGRDLAGSTARQMLLYRALGHAAPRFAHHPLLVDERGQKLSKRDRAVTLRAMRDDGVAPGGLRARLGAAVGLWGAGTRSATPQDFADAIEAFEAPAAALERNGARPPWHDGRWP